MENKLELATEERNRSNSEQEMPFAWQDEHAQNTVERN